MRRGEPDAGQLAKSADRLGHRGPDDRGIHVQDSLGLAHTRLSIVDLAGGHQPILDYRGNYALVVNGEIYNISELRQELRLAGCCLRTRSDSEVLLHLYDREGMEGFRRLHGMFAAALYCARQQTLLLVCDRLGIKLPYTTLACPIISFSRPNSRPCRR